MIYWFANCALDSRRRELTVGGAPVHLEPQVFDVLRHLVENRERVVSRDELVEAVWHGRIVSDATIGARIFAARQAVGDSGEAQALIRTLPRRGFRFVAPVEAEPGDSPGGGAEDGAHRPAAGVRSRLAAIAALMLLVAGAVAIASLDPWAARIEMVAAERMAYPLPDKPSIAVLPFANIGAGAARDFMGEGLTESLVNALAANPFLFVISRNSTETYTGQNSAAVRAAQELGVRYILEGSVARVGGEARVTAHLVDALGGRVVWSERYVRPTRNFFVLDGEITARIARALDVRINYGANTQGGTRSLEAWSQYVQGRNEYLKFTAEANSLARAHYLRAIETDPDYAEAIVGLAETHLIDLSLAPVTEWSGFLARIGELTERASRIVPDMPQLFELRAMVALTQGDLDRALGEAEAMGALYPGGAESNYLLGQMCFFTGQYARAIEALTKAERLNPGNRASYSSHLAFARLALGDVDSAVATVEEMVERWPDYSPGRVYLAIMYQLAGRSSEARRQVALLPRLAPDATLTTIERRFSPMQDRELAEHILKAAREAGIPG